MADIFTPEQRSRIMSRIRGKDTAPEMVVRRMLHSGGYRYRLHVGGLPGSPDLVFTARKKVIFVHGCFWHRHGDCKTGVSLPKTRTDFWTAKFASNTKRDRSVCERLVEDGWGVFVVWECELAKGRLSSLESRLVKFLEETS
ncbi:MAG: DNA mismatch endonuclease Vsr [Proteobacteria bacterium]|nr:DNA mismatch endonuclease Vsr [Pseudomonadota bacterium]